MSPPPDPYENVDLEHLDLLAHRGHSRVGRGEQGVLRAQPYEDELLPLWRFRTPELARESAAAIRATRTTPVAEHQGGRSGAHSRRELPRGPEDPGKAEAARIVKDAWDAVEQVEVSTTWRAEHRHRHG